MTTLASYTFPAGTDISNAVVRGYATGRYVNNSGSTQLLGFRCLFNTTQLCVLNTLIATAVPAQGWVLQAHFYLQQAVVNSGAQSSIGCTMEARLTNAGTTGSRTGSYVAVAPMQVYGLPFSTFVQSTAANTVQLQVIPAGVGGETLEIGCAYLEAL